MNIKIFIPSYKRLNSLNYVLKSLLETKISILTGELHIFIVNNWPPNNDEIQLLINEFNQKDIKHSKWKIESINRKVTMEPAYSWYNAIVENCNDGDIVFLSGDDDLFTNDSISKRFDIMQDNPDCQILLSSFQSGLIFDQDNDQIYFDLIKFNNIKKDINNAIFELQFSDYRVKNSIFLGNNCYRFNKQFKDGLEKAFSWCDQLTWLDKNTRTLMLPYYIAIAVGVNNGKILFVDNLFILRGVEISEPYTAVWGVSGWNCGFLELTSLCVLNNYELQKYGDFKQVKETSKKIALDWYFTYFFDSRISKIALAETLKHSKIKLTSAIFKSILMLLKQFLRILKIYKYFKNFNFNTPKIEADKLIQSI